MQLPLDISKPGGNYGSWQRNRWFVTDEPVEFEKYPVEVQEFREFTHHFEESMEYTSNECANRKMSTCNRLDLESLGY